MSRDRKLRRSTPRHRAVRDSSDQPERRSFFSEEAIGLKEDVAPTRILRLLKAAVAVELADGEKKCFQVAEGSVLLVNYFWCTTVGGCWCFRTTW